jgi:predicted AAA+ superfamily ATPase
MTELAATQRVRDALDQLQKGLSPFVESNMAKQHGADWRKLASRAGGSDPRAPLDTYALLKTALDNWTYTFAPLFAQRERHRVRNFASTAFEARNATAHLTLPLQDSDALRYLDAMVELLKAVKAPEESVTAVQALYTAQRSHGLAAPAAEAAPPRPQGTLSLPAAAPEAGPRSKLRPWIEVALPHPDVLANRFKQSEFAADLFAVDSGNAEAGDYTDPVQFFRITYLTEGLKRVLKTALERLAGKGGDPVVGLQTAFGGGKTHSMLAAWHLAQVDNPAILDGVREIAEGLGLTGWRRPKVAAFVGTSKGPGESLLRRSGPDVRTLWGYLAWRLAGEAGLKLVAESEAAGTNPGSERFVEVLRLAGPSLILLDELVAYARQLPEDRFEAFLSFIQSLTEAAKMVPDALVIGSLPESEAEAGGDRGKAALIRLEKVFGRVQSPWLPASGDETYEIIRRRLFQPLDGEGEKAREETVKAFHALYRNNAAEFPGHAKEARYQELLRLAYPIHPELFERLSKDWASLPNFQRTRGVLQFMANVIGVLWNERTSDPLITPGRVPVAHERVRASILYPLNPAFGAVVDREVDGPGSLPAQKEANPQRRIAQARAATRAARAVFLCSAPLVGQANAGVTGPTIRLACVEPGDQIAIFGEALRELTEQAAYLYEEAGRYWFSTQPTLNRLADERARALEDYRVDEAILRALQDDARSRASFAKVFAAPDEAASVEEADALSLVILKPAAGHSGRGAGKSAATDAVHDGLTRRGSGQRRFRNTLVFVAPDEGALATAREVMRRALAWASIVDDQRLQAEMTQAQAADAKEKARAQKEAAERAVRNAWCHVFLPVEASEAGRAFDLDHAQLTSRERASIAAAVFDKLKADGLVSEKLGAESFWSKISPLWPEDANHLSLAQLVEWFAAYPYLPKLRDRVVLEKALADTVSKLDAPCAFATAFDEATGYAGLTYAKAAPAILPATSLLVRKSVYDAQAAAAAPEPPPDSGPASMPGQPMPGVAIPADGPPKPVRPTRFFGSVDLDPLRPLKSLEAIIDAVVLQLQHSGGTRVRLTLDIEAETERGFDDADIGVVRDNCQQLKFKGDSTGFE